MTMTSFFQNGFASGDTLVGSIKMIIYSAFVFLNIDADLVNILLCLMGLDTILGISKALVLERKVGFKLLLWGWLSKMSVLLLPLVLALMAKAVSFDLTWMLIAVLDVLIVSEGFSCITNVLSIRQKKEIQNKDFVTVLLQKVRKGLGGIINNILGNIGNEEPR